MEELEQMYTELKNLAHKFYDHDCANLCCTKCPFNRVIAVDGDGNDVDICEVLLKII